MSGSIFYTKHQFGAGRVGENLALPEITLIILSVQTDEINKHDK